jgi:hypothetical protein
MRGLALRLMRHAIRWYAVPGVWRFGANREQRGRDRERPYREEPGGDERGEIKKQVNQFAVPPESILIRRMHAVVAIVLYNLRASADWSAIAAEYLHRAPPATPLGQAEADTLARRGR